MRNTIENISWYFHSSNGWQDESSWYPKILVWYLKLKSKCITDKQKPHQLVKRLQISSFFLFKVLKNKFSSSGMLIFSGKSSVKPFLQRSLFFCSSTNNVESLNEGQGKRWRLRSCSPRKEAKFRASSHERVSLLQKKKKKKQQKLN